MLCHPTVSTGVATPRAPQQSSRSDSIAPSVTQIWLEICVVGSLIGVLFGATLADMAHDWWIVPAYSQGMLLPPLALYMAWVNRHRTLKYDAAPDNRGLLLTSIACCTFLLGSAASEFFLMRFSFIILVTGLIWTFWGIRRLRSLAFPLLLLATMVPLPVLLYNSLAAPLQLLASDIAASVAQSLGISVFRDGNILQLATVSLGVAEACSGLNSLSALVVGSVLLGYMLCNGWIARVLVFIAAAPLAIAVNIVRVAGTAILADYNEEFAMGFYHSFSGWLVFVAGVGLLYGLARLLHALIDPKEQ